MLQSVSGGLHLVLGLDLGPDATVPLVHLSLMSILTMKCEGCRLFVEF